MHNILLAKDFDIADLETVYLHDIVHRFRLQFVFVVSEPDVIAPMVHSGRQAG